MFGPVEANIQRATAMPALPASDDPLSVPAEPIAMVTAIILSGVYLCFGGVWTYEDARLGLFGAAWLWLPIGLFLFATLRNECADTVETLVLAGAGTLGMTTALTFACDTLAL